MNPLPFEIRSYTEADDRIPLDDGAVHLWHLDLAGAGAPASALAVLSAAERARAESYRHEPSRLQFIHGRATLRRLLSRYEGADPAGFQLTCIHGEKPRLPDVAQIHFNLSHAGSCVLLAFSRSGPLGVDIEPLTPPENFLELAKISFSSAELESLRQFPSAGRGCAFLAGWTRKEAVVKALGRGIDDGFRSFTVSLDIRETSPSLDWPDGLNLELRSFSFPGYLAALAFSRG